MKVVGFLVAMQIAGCGFAREGFLTTDYQLGLEKTVTVGSTMTTIVSGTKNSVYGTVIDMFTQELIYGGVASGIVKISYREFSNNKARPALYQDLQYDLSQSSVIAFRDMRIQIDNASNSTITFRVLDGPTSRLPSATNSQAREVTAKDTVGIVVDRRTVTLVLPGTASANAGIRQGDVLVSVNRIDLTGENEHDLRVINGIHGENNDFEIERGGETIHFTIAHRE